MGSLVEPTKVDFFRTLDKIGGPVEPIFGFNEIYTEIFIKKKTRKQLEEEEREREENEEGSNEDEDKSENAFDDEKSQTRENQLAKAEQDEQDEEIDEIENEEEVYMRRDEYKRHPLFGLLKQHTEELQDYITTKLKRHEQMKAAAERMNLGPGAHYNPVTGTFIRTN